MRNSSISPLYLPSRNLTHNVLSVHKQLAQRRKETVGSKLKEYGDEQIGLTKIYSLADNAQGAEVEMEVGMKERELMAMKASGEEEIGRIVIERGEGAVEKGIKRKGIVQGEGAERAWSIEKTATDQELLPKRKGSLAGRRRDIPVRIFR